MNPNPHCFAHSANAVGHREFNDPLRLHLDECVAEVRSLVGQTHLPPPTTDTRRCRECSMRDICQPEATRRLADGRGARSALFDPDA